MSAPELCNGPLGADKHARLVAKLTELADELGQPADWGIATQLGLFTIQVLSIRHAIRATPPEG